MAHSFILNDTKNRLNSHKPEPDAWPKTRHIAIVAKKGRTSAHLVRVKSGVLKLSKLTARELVEEWSDAEYPFERAVAKLLDLGKQHGITDAARLALENLVKTGREPTQYQLFA
jgi:hypothetical protein